MMRKEALAQGIRLQAISVEISNGSGDLLEDEPYSKHLRWARRGYMDAYHTMQVSHVPHFQDLGGGRPQTSLVRLGRKRSPTA